MNNFNLNKKKFLRQGSRSISNKGKKELLVSICVCTYKRPSYLSELLIAIAKQAIEMTDFEFEIIVIDNDKNKSAEETVRIVKVDFPVEIRYYCEPFKNISKARNRAVLSARGNLIVFIDDDEIPAPLWLKNMLGFFLNNDCEGVLGPVIPLFEYSPPNWIIKGRVMERYNPPSGTLLMPENMRTGNILLKKELFNDPKFLFDSKFGLTGGEDIDLFRKMVAKGFKFLWCREASVYERISKERMRLDYHIKRAISRGHAQAMLMNYNKITNYKSFLAIFIYLFVLPLTLFKGTYLFNLYLIKWFDHFGKVLGCFGINPIFHYKN